MFPLLKVLAIFLIIIIMLRRKFSLGVTMLVSTSVLGFLFGLGWLPLIRQVGLTLVSPSTVELIAALVLIMILESVMRQTLMLRAMTDSLFKLPWNPRVLLISIPAIVGFLPSAGGARFSAPLVAAATSGSPYRSEDKVFINFWFRHIWEYSLPLYPGLLLASHFLGIPLSTILIWQWPFTVLWLLLGYWYVFRRYKKEDTVEKIKAAKPDRPIPQEGANPLKSLVANTWPLWATVMLVLGRVPIVPALSVVLGLLIFQKRYSPKAIYRTLTDRLTIQIVFLTWGTMAFKDVLEVSGAIPQVSGAISSLGIPTDIIIFLLPLMIGLLTGLVQACIGVAFPLVMSMIEPTAGYVMLAYVSGVVGVMLSPVHLCLILTVEYFKTDFMRSYKPLLLPGMTVAAVSLAAFELLK